MANRLKQTAYTIIFSIICYSCTQQEAQTNRKDVGQSYQNQVHISATSDPLSLDPRLVRDLGSINIIHNLYEGLMRSGLDQKPQNALAESFTISEDGLNYSFTLRDAIWSDGSPVTSADFVNTWKSILSPDFPAPNAHFLYVIEGAKSAKEGLVSPDKIGISAPSPSTLIVKLEQPTPYFLELLTAHFFFPVSEKLRNTSLKHHSSAAEKYPYNGPFALLHWKPRNEIALAKNPKYWDAASVSLDQLIFEILEDNTALQLFKTGKLDWAGSPLSTLPQDAIVTLKQSGELKTAPAAGTHWFRFNTAKAPFNHLEMRQAFNLALNRQDIVDHITQGDQLPATGITPPSFGQIEEGLFKDNDAIFAKRQFMAALIALKNAGETLPAISLSYGSNDRNRKIAQAVQQQWSKAFGLTVKLDACESQVLFDKLQSGNYQICLGSWYADIRDPINFLEVFKSKDTPTNNTGWENARFKELLEQSTTANSLKERKELLQEAEAILVMELPVSPLFHGSFNYLQSDRLKNTLLRDSGIIDFKNGSIQNGD